MVPVTIWTGRTSYDVGTDSDELNLARCIAADRDFPVPDSRAPMLVVLTDRRLLIGQAKRSLRSERGLRRVLGEVPLDRIEAIEPTKGSKEGWSVGSYYRLALLCVALVWVIARGADAIDRDWFILQNTPVWLPDLFLNVVITLVAFTAWMAYVLGALAKYVQKYPVVEVNLSNGKSILLQLHDEPDSFLSAFRSVSDHHRSTY